jgi:hypothetical protein
MRLSLRPPVELGEKEPRTNMTQIIEFSPFRQYARVRFKGNLMNSIKILIIADLPEKAEILRNIVLEEGRKSENCTNGRWAI